MKTLNKKISLLLAVLLLSPAFSFADDTTNLNSSDSSTSSSVVETSSTMPMNNTMSGVLTPEQKTKLGEIMRSLESELKYIRENLTKENFEDMKKKSEELKNTYLAKVSEAFPNLEEAKKIIENRFQIFFNNQFIVREQVKEIKDKAMQTASGVINKGKEEIKQVRDDKKASNTQIRQETKQVKQDLKAKYREKFLKQLGTKLDSIPTDKLQIVLNNISKKREEIVSNSKLLQAKKDSYLAQLDALIELINEKINGTSDELNIDELLNTK